jgi:preprotein translocase subunit SecD
MNSAVRNFFASTFFGWVIVAIIACWYLFTFQDGRFMLRPNRVKFGIDLVGGVYITLGVETEKAIETELFDKMESLVKAFKEAKIKTPSQKSLQKESIKFVFESSDDAVKAADIIKSKAQMFKVALDGNTIIATLNEEAAQQIRNWAVKGNIQVLRSRIDRLGVGETTIAAQGKKNIVIELPNVDDPLKAKQLIGKAALLEIKLVERSAENEDDLLEDFEGELPDGMQILPSMNGKTFFLVPRYTDLTGRLLKDAFTGIVNGELVVHFKFNQDGGEKFYDLTRKNFKRRLAIIVDGVVISDPMVKTAIRSEGYIQGNFTQENAVELASLLKSGAFVAPVTFEEERKIGPSLGQEAINSGLLACSVGLGLLLVFSIFMYKLAGLFACVTLVYNLLLILLALSWLKATLTLPGIAGMVLTIGMAIDASILIYERIREELSRGVPVAKAVDSGFSDALSVILDSNITTFLVGIVLYYFGTGPILGFSITMMVGIISTLVTGLFFLRSIFNVLLTIGRVQKLSI